MNQPCNPAAVPCGPFPYDSINGRQLRAGAELGVPPRALAIPDCLVQHLGDTRQQAPVAPRPLPVVR